MAAPATPAPWPAFVSVRPGGCSLRVRVVPRAGRTMVGGERDGALLVRLAAAPVEGEANDALIAFLSDRLGVPRRTVRLVAGAHARDKRLDIDGLAPPDVAARLLA